MTLRETAWRFAARDSAFVGSPETIANTIEHWFREGAADGFNVRASSPPDFAAFLQKVVPLLQKRGLFRTEYEHDTLRGHLGLPIPLNRYAAAPGQRKQDSGANLHYEARLHGK